MASLQEKHNETAARFKESILSINKELAPFVRSGSEVAAETVQMLEVMSASFSATVPSGSEYYSENLQLLRFAQEQGAEVLQNLKKSQGFAG